ncbi:hypothetical protein C6501_06770 [Candidatus Poribacteria bacterium]|nr:MAG: hypothetical protein C6501_06770 [Candidatus Poribacteria bacterium]
MSNSDYTSKAIVTCGKAIYQQLKDEVEFHHNGKFLAIDIETQHYEIHDKGTGAITQLLAKYPNATIYLVRIGHRTAYKAGFRSTYGT